MRTALVALALAAPAASQVIESFEHGNEALYVNIAGSADTFNVTNAAARNGSFGGEFVQGGGPSWRSNPLVQTAPGNRYRVSCRVRGGVANNGRSYLGVGGSAAGCWSAVFAPNTSQILLQNNAGFAFTTAASASFAFAADTWYVMELDWATNGDITVSLLDATEANVLATTGPVAAGFLAPGSVILRGFTTNAAVFHDFDTIRRTTGELTITDCIPGEFIDISGTGTALNLLDDAEVNIATTIGNAVFAPGVARVGSNGGMRFDGGGLELGFSNTSLPSANAFSGGQTLLGFWDDFNTFGGTVGNIYWQEINNRLIVQWQGAGFFGQPITEFATFQIQIPASGPVYAQFVYADIEGTRAAGGGSATIGYQAGGTPTTDYQYSLDAPNVVRNGTVLSLTERSTLVFTNDAPGTWIEIAGTGTALNLVDDGEVDIPTTVGNSLFAAGVARVGSNGGVRFNGTNLDLGFTNNPIPDAAAFNFDQCLLPFWDDVNTIGGTVGNIYWQEVGGTLVIQWDDVGFFSNATDRATFQIQVHSSGAIPAQFLYQDVSSTRAGFGNSATVGYQGGGVTESARFSFNEAKLANGLVLSLVQAGRKVGAGYCNANPNSTGRTGEIVLSGSSSISNNNLRLTARFLPTNAFGYFLCSTSTGFIPNAGGSQGNLCLGGNIGRGIGGIFSSGASGGFNTLANLNALPQPGGPVVAQVGETWNFTTWHRDSVGGVATSNFTNAEQVQFTP